MMDYAKDEVFSVNYLSKKDKPNNIFKKRMIKKILHNKFITFTIVIGVVFSILNFSLIYYFFDLFSKI